MTIYGRWLVVPLPSAHTLMNEGWHVYSPWSCRQLKRIFVAQSACLTSSLHRKPRSPHNPLASPSLLPVIRQVCVGNCFHHSCQSPGRPTPPRAPLPPRPGPCQASPNNLSDSYPSSHFACPAILCQPLPQSLGRLLVYQPFQLHHIFFSSSQVASLNYLLAIC